MTQLLVFNITNGLIIGTFYVLMALGLSLILNLSNVINFAHGGFLVLGGYIAYTITPYVGFWGALLIAPPLTAVIGLVVERVLIRPLYGRDPLYSLLLTFGLAFIIEDGTRFIWGAQGKPVSIPAVLAQPLSDEFFFITGYRLFMVVMVVVAVGRAERRACGRTARARADHGDRPADAELHCHNRRRRRKPDRHLAGRIADRRCVRRDRGVSAGGQ
jgi:branched-chain amino acid transport system permease protein